MDAFEAYKTYLAIKAHFNSKDYNYFKYSGYTRANKEKFEKRPDKYFFYKLSKNKDIVNFLVSNFIVSDKWVGDLINDQNSEKRYNDWKKRHESLSYIFKQDLYKLKDDFNHNFKVVDGEHPYMLKLYLRNEISPETILILNDVLNFFPQWNKNINDDYIWPNAFEKLKKYRPFFTIDLEKYKKILVTHLKDR